MTLKEMRVGFLRQMYEYIIYHIGDEGAYARWICLVPDEPQEDDLEFIAEDDELWVDACVLFGKLAKEYEGR